MFELETLRAKFGWKLRRDQVLHLGIPGESQQGQVWTQHRNPRHSGT